MEQEPGRRDLRFKPEIKGKTPIERFEKMEMGDLWDDANLLPALRYAWNSKHLRSDIDWCDESC